MVQNLVRFVIEGFAVVHHSLEFLVFSALRLAQVSYKRQSAVELELAEGRVG